MKDLSLHLENLLLYHDSVIYPQLGTFTTTYVPSKWSEQEELFLPPYRSVSFSTEPKEGNDLFVTTLSRRYRVSATDAHVMCAEYLDYIRQELSENGTMDLGSIGVFVQEEETDPLTFYPAPSGAASPSLYGLDALHMSPVSQPKDIREKEKEHHTPTLESDDRHITIRISRQWAGYVATAAACILLFFTFSTPVENSSMPTQLTAETDFFMPANLIPSISGNTTPVETPAAEAVPEKSTASVTETSVLDNAAEVEQYAVVLASAVSMKNAQAFVESLQAEGYNAQVYVKNDMVRVIIPGFRTAAEVHEQISQMKAKSHKYDKAWTLKIE